VAFSVFDGLGCTPHPRSRSPGVVAGHRSHRDARSLQPFQLAELLRGLLLALAENTNALPLFPDAGDCGNPLVPARAG